jgi:hypothetical protein
MENEDARTMERMNVMSHRLGLGSLGARSAKASVGDEKTFIILLPRLWPFGAGICSVIVLIPYEVIEEEEITQRKLRQGSNFKRQEKGILCVDIRNINEYIQKPEKSKPAP